MKNDKLFTFHDSKSLWYHKKTKLLEEPELREDFILRMKDIDLEKTILVEDFRKRYGRRCL
jgi:hypothetical protein